MKTMHWHWPARNGCLANILLVMFAFGSFAQSSGGDSIPVVTLEATVPIATWAGQEGVITLWRSGNSAPALNVYYCISGTASNGVDYQAIGQLAQLPAGVTSNSIVIKPINLGQTNIESVTLSLCPSPLMMPIDPSRSTSRMPPTAASAVMPPPIIK